MSPLLWRASVAMALAGALLPRDASTQVLHYDSHVGETRGAVTNAALDATIRQAAVRYRGYAPIPRVAFYDVAYPADSTEYVTMHGYALLVVTAIGQDSSELPPSRVYVVSETSGKELQLVTVRTSIVADTAVRSTFGRHRTDAVYLLPVRLRTQGGQLLLDFAKNRMGFRLGLFDAPLPTKVQPMTQLETPSDLPPLPSVWIMLQREYPDLARSLQN